MESYKTFWDISGHFGRLGIFWDIWGHLGAFGDIWGYLGIFGDIWGHLGTFEDIWGHWADICRHQEHESLIRDKKLTKSWKEKKKKAHTKTAPVYAVKNQHVSFWFKETDLSFERHFDDKMTETNIRKYGSVEETPSMNSHHSVNLNIPAKELSQAFVLVLIRKTTKFLTAKQWLS